MNDLKGNVSDEKKITREILSLMKDLEKADSPEEKKMINSQIDSLKKTLKERGEKISEILDKTKAVSPLPTEEKKIQGEPRGFFGRLRISDIERVTLKRLKKKEEETVRKKIRKPSRYANIANGFFSKFSKSFEKKKTFKTLERDLIESNLQFTLTTYISIILLTTALSAVAAIFLFVFLLFFNVSAEFPIITMVTEGMHIRFVQVFWVLFIIPIGTFLIMYLYPSLEKKSIENNINQELPFATINMAAISGSMLDPSKIFSIIIATKEYPYLEKEFTKLINEINIYGYNLVSALRNVALNTPSKKLSELLNGIATTITSGGNLPDFFDKRSQTLLFDYRLEREKYTKAAETFMDIYISVVIATPMILMLLLIMMKISGLGITLSTSAITLMMVLGVGMINIAFLVFLYLKQPKE